MKILTMDDIANTSREVRCPHGGFTSFRYVLAHDDMGFSLHKTMIPKGEPQHWHYTNHLEACFCVSGRGILKNLRTEEVFIIQPDMCYALDEHDDHTFQAIEDTVLVSVFNPPVTGTEVHREDGSYERL